MAAVYPHAQSNLSQGEPFTPEPSIDLHSLPLLPTPAPTSPPLLPLETITNLTPPPPQASDSTAITEDFCLEVPVVMYHHIQPLPVASLLGHEKLTVDSSLFEQQMRYLKEHNYQTISADELVNALTNKQQLPEKSIVITIDDGYDDNYTYAFLTAKKYELIMNFMIPTKLIGKPGYMNWDHLREMHANDYSYIYNHTATHAPLGYILKDQIASELTNSIEDFERELGLKTGIFAYPYGSYNAIAIHELKERGFTAAFTTNNGKKHCTSSIMELQRIRIGNAPMSRYGF